MPLDLNDKFSLSHGSITHDVYVYLTNETQVIAEMNEFLATLH
jgi:hypothetical protein